MESDFPSELSRVDLARIRFVLEFDGEFVFDLTHLLGLRNRLNRAARRYYAKTGRGARDHYQALFEPETSDDPVAVRKFQKPAPPFVFQLTPFDTRAVTAGDHYPLDVLFVGSAIPFVAEFSAILQELGRQGLLAGAGRFALTGIDAVSEDDQRQSVWHGRMLPDMLAPPLDNLGSWLARQPPVTETLSLMFETPTRLRSNGRLVRRPLMSQLFPFMLRRVTSMLYHYANCEPWVDVSNLLQSAGTLTARRRSFQWCDWKNLGEHRSLQQLGGFTGRLELEGDALPELYWVLSTASLLGIGKGATFGAGRFRLADHACGAAARLPAQKNSL